MGWMIEAMSAVLTFRKIRWYMEVAVGHQHIHLYSVTIAAWPVTYGSDEMADKLKIIIKM